VDEEALWRGSFGDRYTERNRRTDLIASDTALFTRILAQAPGVASVLELGSNVGLNLSAIAGILPDASLSAVEINERAAEDLRKRLPDVDLHVTSILGFDPASTWDLVFTKGVLIHIDPARLPHVYELMYRATSRYVVVAEYYNPTPTDLTYRGHTGALHKRDFAGEMLDAFPDLSLIDYGFVYHRDPSAPLDDLTWFLMERS
jgi:pseudaminic acid biosynthesis-associated methylase